MYWKIPTKDQNSASSETIPPAVRDILEHIVHCNSSECVDQQTVWTNRAQGTTS